MVRYHILEKSIDNRYADVYIHLPVPATKNVAGTALDDNTLTYQRAVKESRVVYTNIPSHETLFPTEQAQLENGELVEFFVKFRFDNVDLTNANRKQQIEIGNTNQIGVIQMASDVTTPGTKTYNKVIAPLEWWGYYNDV